MTKQQRIALAAVAVVVAIAAFVVLKPDGSEPPVDTAAQTASSSGKAGDHTGHASGHAPGGGGKANQLGATGSTGTVIETKGDEPVGGIAVLNAKVGDPVRFTVKSDTSDEIHVHGYDLKANVAPGKPASFAFPAKIDGIFEIELEDAGAQIARLTVSPR